MVSKIQIRSFLGCVMLMVLLINFSVGGNCICLSGCDFFYVFCGEICIGFLKVGDFFYFAVFSGGGG